MRKAKKMTLIALCGCALFMQSCATIWGGKITDCQRTKPSSGEPARKIRGFALAGDILFFPIVSIPVDFLDQAIYKPCGNSPLKRK